ncbi:chromate resistance protein ChrB domain-containing protein [Falsiroseomonas sp. E2-1-a20]|uniref:chromate resistance protein ChrB domain-containing protein n=1 Tax=Falsiroseomonas sp. E2-1-a20 TaxID=3239300 RepID=UPI003F3FD53B
MPSPFVLTPQQLSRLIGLPDGPVLVDVRDPGDRAEDPRLLPASQVLDHQDVAAWAPAFRDRDVIVICQKGLKLSEGVAAWLRHEGSVAQVLEGGFAAWRAARMPLLEPAAIPPRDPQGRTVWVTRARPKVDRIACPWLIRRFVDPSAMFLFVAASQVELVAERFNATPFDIEGVFWTHRGDGCTFDTMLEEFGLRTPTLERLAMIIRGAETSRADLAPQSAGLLAASLGLSRLHRDDLAQLEAGLALYDAFHLWCRDATEEVHDWPNQGYA